MEKSDVADALRALAKDSANRTKIGRLREIIDEVSAAQAAGVRNSRIFETLNQQGFGFKSVRAFEAMVRRIRKEKGLSVRGRALDPKISSPKPEFEAEDDEPTLDPKQRREKLADRFIKPETTNPLLKRVMEEKKK